VRKIFYTLFLTHLTEQKIIEKVKEEENEIISKRKIENKIDSYMRSTAVNAVRYILSEMNKKENKYPTKSLALINSFLCFLPFTKIAEICGQPNLSVAVAVDLSADYGVIVFCIDAALSVIQGNTDSKYAEENEVKSEGESGVVTVGEKKFDNEVAKETLNEVENEVESGVAKEVVKGGVDVFRCFEEASMLLALLANKVRHVSFVCLYVCQIACESVFVSLRLFIFLSFCFILSFL
jgi:hypothetical protein